MAWTAKDAAAHSRRTKGSPKLQKQWAAAANATLESELARGTERTRAERIALTTANQAVARKPAACRSPSPAAAPREPQLHCRLAAIAPTSINEDDRTVRAVLATESICLSIDQKTKKSVLEVYLMSGLEPVSQVPLCDNHQRGSIENVKGSTRDIAVQGDQVEGLLVVADSEYAAWEKIRNRHVTDVSAGFLPVETTEIKAGQTKVVAGRSFTAPAGRSLFVHTRWQLREVSLTPIGSDQRAKIRTGESQMNKNLRKWLEENLNLRAEATDDEAQTFWDALPTADRTRAEAECEREDEEEDEENDEEEETPAPAKKSMRRVTRQSVVTEETRTAEEQERIRSEAEAAGRQAERRRVASIRKAAGPDVPAEIVDRAISEEWSVSRFRGVALEHVRRNRTASAGGGGNVDERTRQFSEQFGIHTRSHDTDCTEAALGAALFLRTYSGQTDPLDVVGGYQPIGATRETGNDGVERLAMNLAVRSDVTRMISGRSRTASEERRKAAERLLDLGDRYRSISLLEMCDEACRIEGRQRTSWDPEERVRAAMSGNALSAIFTQNISALFLGGYLDAADTTQGWTTETDVPNFLQNERAIFGKMGQLTKLGRGQTANDLDTSDWNEVYKIARYAGKWTLDEQDMINDRFGAQEQMGPQDMGMTARQIRANLVYAMLLANPVLNQDNTEVFHANHANIVTGAITDFNATAPTANAGPLQDATTLMGKQRLRNRVLNLRPRYAIAGTDLEWALNILYKSQQRVIASASGGTYNPLAAEGANVEIKLDGRLDPLGCYNNDDGKTYYPWSTTGLTTGKSLTCILAARPGEQGAKTVEVGYLRGTGRAPRIRSAILREGSGQYGYAWDVNLDIGAKILDYRGLVLITGNGTQLAATGP